MKVKEIMLKAKLDKSQNVVIRDMSTAETFKTAPGTIVLGLESEEVKRIINLKVTHFSFNDTGIIILAG